MSGFGLEVIILTIVGVAWVLLFLYLRQRHDSVLRAQTRNIEIAQQTVEQQRQLIELMEQLISVNWDVAQGGQLGSKPRKAVG